MLRQAWKGINLWPAAVLAQPLDFSVAAPSRLAPALRPAAPQVEPRVVYWPTFFSDFSADINPEMSADIVSALVDVRRRPLLRGMPVAAVHGAMSMDLHG